MDMQIYIFSVCLSVLGGLLRYLRVEPSLSIRGLLMSFLLSIFSGILVCCLINFLELKQPDLCAVFAGVAGYSGSAFLDNIVNRVCDMFFSKFTHTKEEKKQAH